MFALTVGTLASLAATGTNALSISTSLPMVSRHEATAVADGRPDTWFESARPTRDGDDFLVQFPEPFRPDRIRVLSGDGEQNKRIEFATLEVSVDGTNFTFAARFHEGAATAASPPAPLRALRLRFTGGGSDAVAIREIEFGGAWQASARFVTRVEVDCALAPEAATFATRAAEIVTEWYPRLRELLPPDDEPPLPLVRLYFRPFDGVAYTEGDVIHVSSEWVTRKAPDDYGMVVHELTHVVQNYQGGGEGWLTEGIADYTRFWHFEPGAWKPEIDPDQDSFRSGYRVTAAFLAWLVGTHDPEIVRKLNTASRRRQPAPPVFLESTGKAVDVLWREFADGFRRPPQP